MTAFPRQVDIKRAIRAAIASGMAPGSFVVEIGDGSIRLLPANESRDDASSDVWERGLSKWRRSG
jgi:hypothetical protein